MRSFFPYKVIFHCTEERVFVPYLGTPGFLAAIRNQRQPAPEIGYRLTIVIEFGVRYLGVTGSNSLEIKGLEFSIETPSRSIFG